MSLMVFVNRYVTSNWSGDDEFEGSFYVECCSSDSIGYLKIKLESVYDFPFEEFRLVRRRGGILLDNDEKTMAEYDIKENEYLDMKLPATFVPPWKRRKTENGYVKSTLVGATKSASIIPGCFPKYDKYPVPLISRAPSRIVYGADRWRFAIWYLQPERLEEILKEQENLISVKEPKVLEHLQSSTQLLQVLIKIVADYATEITLFETEQSFKTSFIGELCAPNHPSNLFYSSNSELYRECIRVAGSALSPEVWKRLNEKFKLNVLAWGVNEAVHYQIELQKEKRHWCLKQLQSYGVEFPSPTSIT